MTSPSTAFAKPVEEAGISIPDWIDYDVWRVVSHESMSATLQEIETHWNLFDLLKANLMIDIQEELQYRAEKKNKVK